MHIAHRLYRDLFGQVEDLIRGRKLIVVATGLLTQLPFHTLVTEAPSGDYRDAAWLARASPIAVLPAVSALEALRSHARASAAAKPYLGIGNPLRTGPDERDARLASLSRSLRNCRSISSQSSVNSVCSLFSGIGQLPIADGLAEPASLRRQALLPETA